MKVSEVDLGEKSEKSEKDTKKSKAKKDEVKVIVLNMSGDTLRRYTRKVKPGMNTIGWDMRQKGVRFPSRSIPKKNANDPGGLTVLPGIYKMVFQHMDHKDSIDLTIKLDPRLNITERDLEARRSAQASFESTLKSTSDAFTKLMKVKKSLGLIENVFTHEPDSTKKMVGDTVKSIKKEIAKIEKEFMLPEGQKGIQDGSKTIMSSLWRARSFLNSAPGQPGSNALNAVSTAKGKMKKGVDMINTFLDKDWENFKSHIQSMDFDLFPNLDDSN